MNQKPKIIAISGPSATGKSNLAVALAEKYNAEIISADSRYIYKYIDIAAAKPTEEEKKGIPHHLIDICEVTFDYTVGHFVKDAAKLIKELTIKGKTPIVVGGTGLYFSALSGEFDIPEVEPDTDFRKKAEKLSCEELYKELQVLNIELANKIHPNNKVKIIRALELAKSNAVLTSKESPYDILWFGLTSSDRNFLYKKADFRVEKMFQSGLLEEAEMLFSKYGENRILLNTIGVKELYDVIYNHGNIDFAKGEIKKNTRHYIKRQISWFKRVKNIKYFDISENTNVPDYASNETDLFLSGD